MTDYSGTKQQRMERIGGKEDPVVRGANIPVQAAQGGRQDLEPYRDRTVLKNLKICQFEKEFMVKAADASLGSSRTHTRRTKSARP
ncbi:hypothetical protein CLCR_06483 [Cladophialophora carrionii]|uniref:Uncharacterized protein n=1 Tax=Cladophialophora carrionii TaxID=86049 RepID=A0A1C1C7P0_9EURO|nr:hypothetical protein CLCR_06483 [Cladophialophora carrionii]